MKTSIHITPDQLRQLITTGHSDAEEVVSQWKTGEEVPEPKPIRVVLLDMGSKMWENCSRENAPGVPISFIRDTEVMRHADAQPTESEFIDLLTGERELYWDRAEKIRKEANQNSSDAS